MSGYIAIFERSELKYRLSPPQVEAFMQAVEKNMIHDAYGKTLISSMYWDTPNRSLIGRSVEHPLYKEKLRLRRYGSRMLLDENPCFVELKKKYKGIVYKRRLQTSGVAARQLLAGSEGELSSATSSQSSGESKADISHSAQNRQVAAEVAAFRHRSGVLVPSMLIECERTAWVLPPHSPYSQSELRITLDEDLRYLDLMTVSPSDEPLAARRAGPLIAPGEAVLEIKALNAMPHWLVRELSENAIRPASFTKYGSAYATVMCGSR